MAPSEALCSVNPSVSDVLFDLHLRKWSVCLKAVCTFIMTRERGSYHSHVRVMVGGS